MLYCVAVQPNRILVACPMTSSLGIPRVGRLNARSPMRRRFSAAFVAALHFWQQVEAQTIADVEPAPLPAGVDAFALDLEQIRKHSATSGFEIVGHSYFKVPQRTDFVSWQVPTGRKAVIPFSGSL